MRRRIASIVTGAALLLGGVGALTPGNTAVLCPPGCLVTGAAKTIGGFPDPTTISMSGSITVIASTRTGEIADAAAVNKTYFLYINGNVTQGAGGALSGTASFHANTSFGGPGGYDFFGGTVQVSGTKSAVRLSGSGVEATLVAVPVVGGYQGVVTHTG